MQLKRKIITLWLLLIGVVLSITILFGEKSPKIHRQEARAYFWNETLEMFEKKGTHRM